jgi:tRNA pseudouridine55 synthase
VLHANFNGILNLDKPADISSARAVNEIKWKLPRGVKVGHAGTLDPFATGVLLILVGKATKLAESLMARPKRYTATIQFGATTETLDPTSPQIPAESDRVVDRAALEAVLPQFIGQTLQKPPAYSALKVGGRRAYELARDGKLPELQPRPIQIYSLALTDFAWPLATIDVECGRGTYIRSLARDLATAVGSAGYLTTLRRTRSGDFAIANACQLAELQDQETILARLHMPAVNASESPLQPPASPGGM